MLFLTLLSKPLLRLVMIITFYSLLCDTAEYNINHLQQIKKTMTHLVTNIRNYSFIALILQELHLLLVSPTFIKLLLSLVVVDLL